MSENGVFELGLFEPDSSSRDGNRWYLGIWFKKIPTRTYVWVANRDNPLYNPVGTIRVWKSNLVLSSQSNTLVWSTNVKADNGRSPLVAKLLDDGNFVIRYSNASDRSGNLWQSFDFPTDTLIPGMKLGWERRIGRNSLLRSWKDLTDPSTGNFSYGIENQSRGFPVLFLWLGSYKVSRISPWNGVISGLVSAGVSGKRPSTYLTYALTENVKEVSFSFQILDPTYTSILKLRPFGNVQQLWWNETNSRWDLLWASLNDQCDIFQLCGPFGYCDRSTMCNCMRGFEPKDPEAWALNSTNDGCVRKKLLSCTKDKFYRRIDIKLPDTTNAIVEWDIEISECEPRCVRDCNCTAFTTLKENRRSGCVIWTGELFDVREYVADGQDLYVRYHGN